MEKIKIAVLNPVGDVVNEMEINWSADHLEGFLCGNRIVVYSNEEPVHFVSEKHRWNPNLDTKNK
jgi:hypothetical protein